MTGSILMSDEKMASDIWSESLRQDRAQTGASLGEVHQPAGSGGGGIH